MKNSARLAFTSLYEEYETYIDKISKSKNKENLLSSISSFVEFVGCEYYVYACFTPSDHGYKKDEIILINGYPQEWRDHYDYNGYASFDPVVKICKKSVMPFKWSNIDCGLVGDKPIMEEAKEFGLSYGWTVPLHSIGGEWSLLSIASSSCDDFFMRDNDPRLALSYLVMPAINKVMTDTCAVKIERKSKIDKVTEREREVIAWAADGKTNWEISKIMVISESTVRFHIKNVSYKMGASNKVSAVSKAILYGVI
ncbi:LuxR family transcriptional regulator [Halomonas sp. SpR8]|uniref:LuxR family transcriptional regulator n=1 Tax=Halomonas sp. SpR8 TaxID=3050463 RepID=UPI0027E41E4A|nr:LuxR family transcriptional regulator [Halomonas sp. SpR8]MDQ7730605.1 LuxR family transcriptional regulator [Halomonas sp. SpR8]